MKKLNSEIKQLSQGHTGSQEQELEWVVPESWAWNLIFGNDSQSVVHGQQWSVNYLWQVYNEMCTEFKRKHVESLAADWHGWYLSIGLWSCLWMWGLATTLVDCMSHKLHHFPCTGGPRGVGEGSGGEGPITMATTLSSGDLFDYISPKASLQTCGSAPIHTLKA